VFPQIQDEYAPLTESVLAAAFEVTNTLGCGFLEKVYERALHRELTLRGIKAIPQVHFPVKYKSYLVGEYTADFLIEDQLIVELKCASSLQPEHTAQCLNYLRAANKPICLLINFHNPKLEWRRLKPREVSPSSPSSVAP
jgi:GxxExxY protein